VDDRATGDGSFHDRPWISGDGDLLWAGWNGYYNAPCDTYGHFRLTYTRNGTTFAPVADFGVVTMPPINFAAFGSRFAVVAWTVAHAIHVATVDAGESGLAEPIVLHEHVVAADPSELDHTYMLGLPLTRMNSMPFAAASPDGHHQVVVWMDSVVNPRIAWIASHNYGITWSAPALLAPPPPGATGQTMPTVT
jgi:hypothetical protein